jgi:hypothetical protein
MLIQGLSHLLQLVKLLVMDNIGSKCIALDAIANLERMTVVSKNFQELSVNVKYLKDDLIYYLFLIV